MSYDCHAPFSSVAIMGPAVTTYQGLNMGFRIHEIDGDYSGTTNVSSYFYGVTKLTMMHLLFCVLYRLCWIMSATT